MQATTEQGHSSQDQGELAASPVPKVASPTRSAPSLRHLEVRFPPARGSFGVGIPPLFLLAPHLPAAFQPNTSALVAMLPFVSVVSCLDLCLYL